MILVKIAIYVVEWNK